IPGKSASLEHIAYDAKAKNTQAVCRIDRSAMRSTQMARTTLPGAVSNLASCATSDDYAFGVLTRALIGAFAKLEFIKIIWPLASFDKFSTLARGGCSGCPVARVPKVAGVLAVLDPLPDVSVHIVQSPGIGFEGRDRHGLSTKLACWAAGEPVPTMIVGLLRA